MFDMEMLSDALNIPRRVPPLPTLPLLLHPERDCNPPSALGETRNDAAERGPRPDRPTKSSDPGTIFVSRVSYERCVYLGKTKGTTARCGQTPLCFPAFTFSDAREAPSSDVDR